MTASSCVRWIVAVWLIASSGFVDAADSTWIGTTDALWSTTTNWDPSAPTSADRAIFNGAGNANTTINLGAGQSTLGVLFTSSNAAAYTIGSGGVNAQTLTLAATGTIGVDSTVVTDQVFNAAVRLGDATAGTYTFQNDDLANLLTFSGSVAGGTGGTAGAKTLNLTGAGNTTIAGAIANGGATSLSLTKSGTGTLTLSGVNTYTGATTVNGGILAITGTTNTGATNTTTVASTGTARMNISGNYTTGTFNIGTASGAVGAVYQTGGTTSVSAPASVFSMQIGRAGGAYGYYGMTSGSLSVNEVGVGGYNGGNSTGILDVSGGTFNVNGWIALSRSGNAAQNGVLNVSGSGTVIAVGSGGLQANWGGTNVVTVSGSGLLRHNANFAHVSSFSSGTGIVNLNGGTFEVNGGLAGGATLSLLNLNGGTLRSLANNTLVADSFSAAYVYGGGAIIDTNGFTSTVAEPLLAPGGSGVSSIAITGAGSGYIAPPLVAISGGGGTGATGFATIANGTISGITITNPGTGYTSAPTVTLSGGGGSGATIGTVTTAANASGGLTKTGAGTLTLTGASTYTGTTSINSGTLQIGGGGTAGAISPSSVITGSAGGTLAFNRTNTLTQGTDFNSVIGGAIGVTKLGSGTLVLNGANTYTGATTVSAGVLNVVSGGSINAGGGIVTVANGASNATLTINGGAVTSGQPMSIGGASGTGAGVVTVNSGALTAIAEIYVGSNHASAGYGALLINGGTVTTTSWLAIGRGISAGTADTRGLVQMTGGALNVGGIGNLSIGAFRLSTAATSVMAVSGGTAAAAANVYVGENLSGILDVSGGRVQTGAGNSVSLRNVNNAGTIGFLNLRGGTVAAGAVSTSGTAGTSIFNFNGGTLEALQSNATFMQGLTQANVFAGGGAINTNGFNVTIAQNLLAASGTGLSTIAFTGGTGYVAPPIVNISGGGGTGATALATVDANGNLTGITVTNPGTGYTSNPTITLSGGGGSGATIGAITTAANTSGGLTKSGAGVLTLSGSNSFTGATRVGAGGLTIANADALQNSTLDMNPADSGTVSFSQNSTLGGLSGSRNLDMGTRTLTIGGNGQSTTYSGGLSNGALTKLGSGTLTLSGSNGYTGATAVDAGTLVVNGSLANASLTVASGATLMGSGTIAGLTTIAGMHLPGTSPGVETFTNLTYNAGAGVQWELWGNTDSNSPTTAFDQIVVNGNLTFSGATTLDLVFTGSAGPSSFSSVSWANDFWDSNQEWLLYDVAGTLAAANNLTLNVTNWQDSTGAFFQTARPNASFSVEQRASDVYIVYAAVPEPGTLVLAGIGVAAVVALRCRRRRRAAA